MEKSILIGTSGWSYEDWIGNFYPEDLPKNKFLYFYSQHFNTVEINFSYYSLPNKYIINSILKNTPNDFVFTVKLHNSFTHQKDFEKPYSEIPIKERDEFLKAIESLRNNEKLDTILAQFPQSFHHSEGNLEYIVKLRNAFEGYILAVEFRSNSWVNDVVLKTFREEDITFVSVDEPDIRGLLPRDFILTNTVGYIRFHSRDKTKWYEGEKLRYDYLYSKDELEEWVYKIKDANFQKLYVYFNNCHNGQAVINALMFKELIFG
ncbi:MAG: DUF72 domain-containing protein [Brevinematia bacterium]